jgi:hypothetical protein
MTNDSAIALILVAVALPAGWCSAALWDALKRRKGGHHE